MRMGHDWNVAQNVEDAVDGYDGPPGEFYEEMARHCRCCPDCSTVPCDGVCAAGICDERCRCDDELAHDSWEEENS